MKTREVTPFNPPYAKRGDLGKGTVLSFNQAFGFELSFGYWYLALFIRDEFDSLDEIGKYGQRKHGGNVWHEVIWERFCLWTFPETS